MADRFDPRPDTRAGMPLVYIFVYIQDFGASRLFYERLLGLPVIEEDVRAVKLDARTCIVGLNRAADWGIELGDGPDDSCSMVFEAAPLDAAMDRLESGGVRLSMSEEASGSRTAWFYDPDGHRCALREPTPRSGPREAGGFSPARLATVRLAVRDVDRARSFYGEVLALPLRGLERGGRLAVYQAGGPTLCPVQQSGDQRVAGRGIAPVFHVPDVREAHRRLSADGIRFVSPASVSEIGVTAAFEGPGCHRFYLYEPSEVALSWPSGTRLAALIAEYSPGIRTSVI